MTVNKERVKLLVDALRSGKYEQGQNKLSRDNKHCCLGVACIVAMEHGLDLKVGLTTSMSPATTYNGDENYLPKAVEEWYGFNNWTPFIVIDGRKNYAASFNDAGVPFSSIADGFENTYLKGE